MNDKLRRILGQVMIAFGPYILFGIIITCAIGLFILSWYVLLWGMIIGFLLWLYALIKRYFFPKKTSTKGRIIEHDKD